MELIVPAYLRQRTSQAGAHRRGLKYLVYGPPKSGKSFFLASSPKPILAAACGEPGIEPYLEPTVYDEKGAWVGGDLCVSIYSPADYGEFMKFAMANIAKLGGGSIVFDNFNLLWNDWLEGMEDELGVEEIGGKDWRKVKGPWKKYLRDLMKAPVHLGFSSWMRDIKYQEKEGGPGERGKLEIKRQDNPDVEKTVPYVIDLIFKTENERDGEFRPTNVHTVTFYGGRRPRSVEPSELFTGKTWKFNSRKPPQSVWQDVVGPLHVKWVEGAVDHLGGIEPEQATRAERDLDKVAADEALGRVLREINDYEGGLDGYKTLFMDLSTEISSFQGEALALIKAAHLKKKAALQS